MILMISFVCRFHAVSPKNWFKLVRKCSSLRDNWSNKLVKDELKLMSVFKASGALLGVQVSEESLKDTKLKVTFFKHLDQTFLQCYGLLAIVMYLGNTMSLRNCATFTSCFISLGLNYHYRYLTIMNHFFLLYRFRQVLKRKMHNVGFF